MLALILDRVHAVLVALDGDRLPLPHVAVSGPRPLKTLHGELAARGIALGSPAGSVANPDGGRDFLFIGDRFDAPAGFAWRAIRDVSGDDAIWTLYCRLVLGGYEPPLRTVDVWAFGGKHVEMASQLMHLVVCGAKRVTMGWIDWCRRLEIPVAYAGAINVVTDGFGFPRVVLESVDVRMMPFHEVDEESAAGEGEGDLTYADWREGHVEFFERDAAALGMQFDDSALMAVERFRILHVVGAA